MSTPTPRTLADGTTYQVRIGYGTYQNALAALAAMPPEPEQPIGPALPVGELTWSKLPGAASYSLLTDENGTVWATLALYSERLTPSSRSDDDVRAQRASSRAEYCRSARETIKAQERAWAIVDHLSVQDARAYLGNAAALPSARRELAAELAAKLVGQDEVRRHVPAGPRGKRSRKVYWVEATVRGTDGAMIPLLCAKQWPRIPAGAWTNPVRVRKLAQEIASAGGLTVQERSEDTTRQGSADTGEPGYMQPDRTPWETPAYDATRPETWADWDECWTFIPTERYQQTVFV